ncbi:MAG: hypothetical protein ACI9PZ_000705 [Parvicella sp.]|jgi:hypothetical protein
MKLYTRSLLVLCISAFASACTNFSSIGTTAYSVQEAKQTAAECCETLDSLQYKQLPLNEKVRLAVNRDDAIYHYAKDGSSFVEALALPLNAQSSLLEIEIESEIVHNRDLDEKHIFFPVLTFLDGNKKVIKTVDSETVSFQSPTFSKAFMRVVVRLTGDIRDARYVLIHTTEEKLDYAISKTDENLLLQTSGFDTMIFAPIKSPKYRVNFGSEGWMRVTVSG